jgi:hypothetical protein
VIPDGVLMDELRDLLERRSRTHPMHPNQCPDAGRLRRLPGVVDRTVAQLLHRLLQVGTAVVHP